MRRYGMAHRCGRRAVTTASPGELSKSARAALRWAAIGAAARTGLKDHAEPDSLDLVAGVALSHLHDSPVRVLLEHFEIPMGAILSAAGPRPYTPAALLEAAGDPSLTDRSPESG